MQIVIYRNLLFRGPPCIAKRKLHSPDCLLNNVLSSVLAVDIQLNVFLLIEDEQASVDNITQFM